MVDVKTLYERDDEPSWRGYEDGFSEQYNYNPMTYAFGNVVLHESDNDYQGDDYLLYDNDGKVGHLIFGWGSCSGCDSLQACDSWEDLQSLCDSLESSIKWFDSYEAAYKWFVEHDWEGDWFWHHDAGRKYVEEAKKYLMDKIKPTLSESGIKYFGRDIFHKHLHEGMVAASEQITFWTEENSWNIKDVHLVRENYIARFEAAREAGENL